MIKRWLIVFFAITIFISGCGREEEQQPENEDHSQDPLRLFTTVYAWEAFAAMIGGEEVEVENLIPPGSDAHSYEPSARTMVEIAEADAFLYNGAGMEGFTEAVNKAMKGEDVKLINVTENMTLHAHESGHEDRIEQGHAEDDGHHHGNEDPHVWLDPLLAKEGAKKIKNELTALRPEKASVFEQRYKTLENKLQQLHEDFKELALTADKDRFLVSHAAYGYWEARYDLHPIAVSGLSSSSEPSQKQIKQIIHIAEEHNIHYVLLEKNLSSKTAKVVLKEIGAKPLYLHNLESLTEKDIREGADYFSLMEENMDSLKIALK
ncbi:metal ABC transporter solute-binding protein, Zn/Mn family [Bacillus piscicola]|uniref:metal ABC transporter solute-binding protein, Zn/Mn family n=1 Tax=Bacillus piscicola TaxID=1632684 RepID=UPI001F09580E|nr:zinc ABC transporter substrate-binding protein [Bacillus piscicola]